MKLWSSGNICTMTSNYFPKWFQILCGYQSSFPILRFTNFLEKYYSIVVLIYISMIIMSWASPHMIIGYFNEMSTYIYCSFFFWVVFFLTGFMKVYASIFFVGHYFRIIFFSVYLFTFCITFMCRIFTFYCTENSKSDN